MKPFVYAVDLSSGERLELIDVLIGKIGLLDDRIAGLKEKQNAPRYEVDPGDPPAVWSPEHEMRLRLLEASRLEVVELLAELAELEGAI